MEIPVLFTARIAISKRSMKKNIFVFPTLLCLLVRESLAQDAKPPVHLAVVGLVHDHVGGFFPRLQGRQDVQLVGIVETNQVLINRYSRCFHFDPSLFYPSLEALFAKTNVQAVATFTTVFAHAQVVETCATHGITVMMEKPLAANMKQANAI